MANNDYGCFRYFLVPFKQVSFDQLLVKNKTELFEHIINNIDATNDFSKNINNENSNDDKFKLYLIKKLNLNTYVFKFGKERYTIEYKDTGNDITEHEIKNYPFIYIIINTKTQIILLEKKSSVFSKLSTSVKAIEFYINSFLSKYGYEFKIDELTETKNFWEIINKAEKSDTLYQVSLTLKSPNLFGGNTSAEDAVREFHNSTQSTENILVFKNTKGKLKLIRKDLKTFIEYITCGGGKWSIKALIPGSNKKVFSSKDSVKLIQIPNNIESDDISINNTIESSIEKLNTNPGDDNSGKENTKFDKKP